MQSDYQYDVAISFAGEDREVADQLAHALTEKGAKVFYDIFEQGDLWGKDLFDHLADVYSRKAKYCIMLLSEAYAKKAWTKHERQHAQARAFASDEEYILPVRLDDAEIPGIAATLGFLDLRQLGLEEVVRLTMQKLGIASSAATGGTSEAYQADPMSTKRQIPIPRVKREFSDRDRDEFLRGAYDHIESYFQEALGQLEGSAPQIETDFQKIDRFKFTAKIYLAGNTKQQCRIWVGGPTSSSSISYGEGRSMLDNDNSMNDWLSLEDDNGCLGLRASGFGSLLGASDQTALMGHEDAAEYFWRRFVQCLDW